MSGQPWLGEERRAWLAEVEGWVRVQVPGTVVELQSIKERVWGAVLRVVTDDGALYFKASGPLCRHELPIIESIAPRWPGLVPDLLAADHERAWMLLADHGQPMGEVLSPAEQVEVVAGLLPTYAEMQAGSTHLVTSWMSSGIPNRRMDQLPRLLGELLDGTSPIGALRLPDAERTQLDAGLDPFAETCAELAAGPTAVGLDHADIHGTNVFVRDGDARLADWGDACITHPFSSVFVPYVFLVAPLLERERRPATLRLRDAYLEPWGDTATHRRAFGLATWVAHVTRAINVAHESAGTAADQGEVIDLLRAWHAKRPLLERPDEVIQPL